MGMPFFSYATGAGDSRSAPRMRLYCAAEQLSHPRALFKAGKEAMHPRGSLVYSNLRNGLVAKSA
jgi:hypothetical protein